MKLAKNVSEAGVDSVAIDRYRRLCRPKQRGRDDRADRGMSAPSRSERAAEAAQPRPCRIAAHTLRGAISCFRDDRMIAWPGCSSPGIECSRRGHPSPSRPFSSSPLPSLGTIPGVGVAVLGSYPARDLSMLGPWPDRAGIPSSAGGARRPGRSKVRGARPARWSGARLAGRARRHSVAAGRAALRMNWRNRTSLAAGRRARGAQPGRTCPGSPRPGHGQVV